MVLVTIELHENGVTYVLSKEFGKYVVTQVSNNAHYENISKKFDNVNDALTLLKECI